MLLYVWNSTKSVTLWQIAAPHSQGPCLPLCLWSPSRPGFSQMDVGCCVTLNCVWYNSYNCLIVNQGLFNCKSCVDDFNTSYCYFYKWYSYYSLLPKTRSFDFIYYLTSLTPPPFIWQFWPSKPPFIILIPGRPSDGCLQRRIAVPLRTPCDVCGFKEGGRGQIRILYGN